MKKSEFKSSTSSASFLTSNFAREYPYRIKLHAGATNFIRIVLVFVALTVGFLKTPTVSGRQIDPAMQQINPEIDPPFEIDDENAKANGIEIIRGQHLILYTDVRDQARIADLIRAFDAAVPQWCELFGVPVSESKAWKMRVFLIASSADVSRFQKSELLSDVPAFAAGFQRDHNLWFFDQPDDYYTRHLMLHEGTHAFMQWFTGGYGAPWYSEGSAELCGLHQWDQGKIKLRYRIHDRSEAVGWGRIRLIIRDKANGKAMSLDEVLTIAPNAFRDVRYYAWSWAGCEFFSQHPQTKDSFANLIKSTKLNGTEFNRTFRENLKKDKIDWKRLEDDWSLFIEEAEYGYVVESATLKNLKATGDGKFAVASDSGWQSTGIEVKKGEKIKIAASGKFIVGNLETRSQKADSTKSKMYSIESEANGVTVFYYRGRPLGELLAGVLRPEGDPIERISGLTTSQPIGKQRTIEAAYDGVLCLRINESPAKLGDNVGSLEVTVERLK